jgi:hypothetical protein
MKVSKEKVLAELAKVKIQHYRFEGTYGVIAVASDERGFILGTGVGACVDPTEFDYETGKQVATENAMKQAEDKLWEIEGIMLRAFLTSVDSVKHDSDVPKHEWFAFSE